MSRLLTFRHFSILLFSLILLAFSPSHHLQAQDSSREKEKEKKKKKKAKKEKIKVVTKLFKPFVMGEEGKYYGFSIDLLKELSRETGLEYELYGVKTITQLLEEVEKEKAHFAIAAISMTHKREEKLDFSYPIYHSGFQIMVSKESETTFGDVIAVLIPLFFSPKIGFLFLFIFLAVLVAAHIMWLAERKHSSQFPRSYKQGIGEAFWWAAVTITTVGYGDKVPHKFWGRIFGLFWMFIGVIIFAYFTANVTTQLTVNELRGTINGPGDLPGKRIGTVKGSTAFEYLQKKRLDPRGYKVIDDAYQALKKGEIQAIVYDSPALLYHASHRGKSDFKVVGPLFHEESYGIALPTDSPHRERINLALLKLQKTGVYEKIYRRWFKSDSE